MNFSPSKILNFRGKNFRHVAKTLNGTLRSQDTGSIHGPCKLSYSQPQPKVLLQRVPIIRYSRKSWTQLTFHLTSELKLYVQQKRYDGVCMNHTNCRTRKWRDCQEISVSRFSTCWITRTLQLLFKVSE